MVLTRRQLVLATIAASAAIPLRGRAQDVSLMTAPIPSSGEKLPLVGLGSWITFNVGEDRQLKDECAAVIAAFLDGGGRMIDSSPMYGSSQPTIGYGLAKLGDRKALFSAEKVWTSDTDGGAAQIEQSRKFWGVPKFDLVQVHNLLAWREHLPLLFKMKSEGRLRYAGVTTSHGRRHNDIIALIRAQPIDFVQVTYNVVDREVEEQILPLAQERGVAVIVNRPFQQGVLIRKLEGKALPPWAGEIGAKSWAQLLLKFVISHPAVTCAIPATSRVDHVRENLATATGTLPDASTRRKIAAYVEAL